MRILIATYAHGAVGGVESYLRGITPGLIGRGHQVALMTEHRFETAPGGGSGEGGDPYAGCAAEWCLEEVAAAGAVAAARNWGPELVWIHGLSEHGLEAGLLELAPAMLFAHNYDGACATGAKFQRWPQAHPCGRLMGAGCAAVNFTQNCGMLNPAGFARQWQRQRRRQQQFGRYRRVMVASQHMAGEMERHGVAAERVRRLAYPLTEAQLSGRGAGPEPRAQAPHRVLMLARLTRAKGGDVLLQAGARAQTQLGRKLKLTIAGEGPERARLVELAQRLGVEAEFPGWIGTEERRRRIEEADLAAVPSVWPEPFGMVGIEAAAAGVPAVGFALGGIPEWLEAGRNGELAAADPPTAAGLAAALVRALEPAHWQRLRRGAWDSAAAYAPETHLRGLEAVFAEFGAQASGGRHG